VATLRTIGITVFCNVVLCNLVRQVPTFLSKINTYLPLNLNIFIDLVLSKVPQPSKIMYSIFFPLEKGWLVQSPSQNQWTTPYGPYVGCTRNGRKVIKGTPSCSFKLCSFRIKQLSKIRLNVWNMC